MRTAILALVGLLLGFSAVVASAMIGNRNDEEEPIFPDVATLDFDVPDARRAGGRVAADYAALSEEKDTLISTLQTAMVLFQELSSVEREIVGEELNRGEEAPSPWDDRVRSQLDRLRTRYAELESNLGRTEARLRELGRVDGRLRASLEDALRTAAALREDNEQKQALIVDLTNRVHTLTGERDAAVALSVARADTIEQLYTENNTVYWIAGTEDELIELGVIEKVGGATLVFAKVGETLAPRGFDRRHFEAIDRRITKIIDPPAGGRYEILTKQNLSHAAPGTIVQDGDRRLVQDRLQIVDVRFWDPAAYLILVRR